MADERIRIRTTCASLRRLLAAEKPAFIMEILQDLGNIECDALTANGDELRAVAQSLNDVLQSLRELGIITPQNWKEFFGEQKYFAAGGGG